MGSTRRPSAGRENGRKKPTSENSADERDRGTGSPPGVGANSLLAALPESVQQELAKSLEPVELVSGDVLAVPNEALEYAYFPMTAALSMINVLPDGRAVEVGTIGHEGMFGLPLLFGLGSTPAKVIVQIDGHAHRIEANVFADMIVRFKPLQERLLRYAQAFLDSVSQSVACNRLHPLEERCARWILMAHDRIGRDEIPLTQQFLSFMLGVRRAGVSVAAEALQSAGLLTYTRGRITILDREGLESAACPCYAIMRANSARALGYSSVAV